MTVHVLHAGDGYTYLTRQVASADQLRVRGQDLADYYTAQGNPPGRWLGSGLADLGIGGEVSEAQMKALFGQGAHPDSQTLVPQRIAVYVAAGETPEQAQALARKDVRLGRAFPTYDRVAASWGQVLKTAYASQAHRRGIDVNDLDPAARALVRDRTARSAFAVDRGRLPEDGRELKAWVA